MIEDTDLEEELAEVVQPKRKKLMVFLIPLLIVIGISVAIYFSFNKTSSNNKDRYKIIQYDKDQKENISVFYDLPEITVSLQNNSQKELKLKLKVNLELSSIEDLEIVEILTPRLNDAILSHVIELTYDEVKGSNGLYWLKEELLYRLNLVSDPIKIKNLNFSVFELQK